MTNTNSFEPKLSLETNTIEPTANPQAAINGLWRKSKKVCMQALAWNLLKDLKEEGIGTNEVEMESLKRSWQREVKKGYCESLKKFKDTEGYRRDLKYVMGLLDLRIDQARSDWEEARRQYREQKKHVLNAEGDQKIKNWMKKEYRRMTRNYRKRYEEGRKNHRKKVQHLERRYSRKPTVSEGRKEENRKTKRDKWISSMAAGRKEGRQFSRIVPLYGGVELDKDEKSVLVLPEKYSMYPRVTVGDAVYEGTLCNTKVGWTRRTLGSPKEQEEQALLEKDPPQPIEEERMKSEILENESRELFNPEDKFLISGR